MVLRQRHRVVFALTDGWDLGIGAISRLGKSDDERRIILRSIEPNWEGNQTWLVIAGGVILPRGAGVCRVVLPVRCNALVLFALFTRRSASSTEQGEGCSMAHCLGLGPLHCDSFLRWCSASRSAIFCRACRFISTAICALTTPAASATAESLRLAGRVISVALAMRRLVPAPARRRRHRARAGRGERCRCRSRRRLRSMGVWVAIGVDTCTGSQRSRTAASPTRWPRRWRRLRARGSTTMAGTAG